MENLQTQNSCSKQFVLWNRLSKYGAVANWCQTTRLGRGEKGRVNLSVDQKTWTSVPLEEVQQGIWKQFAKKHFELRSTHSYVKKLTSNMVFQTGWSFKLDLTRTGSIVPLCQENTHFLELILNHNSLQQFLEVRIVKFLQEYWVSDFNSINSLQERERQRVCGWPQKGAHFQ